MAPHHETREHHGSHLPTEWRETPERERFESEDTAERLEMDRSPPAPGLTWSGVKEAVYVAGGIIGFLLTGCATYYGVVGEIRDSRKDLEALTSRVVIIERGRSENLPRLEEALRMNGLQDQRLQNLTEANARTSTAGADSARRVDGHDRDIADLRVRQAVIEERLGHGLPHDR